MGAQKDRAAVTGSPARRWSWFAGALVSWGLTLIVALALLWK
jgi:hypothetical protein